jgi:integrase
MNLNDIRDAQPNTLIWDKEDRNSVTGLHLKVSPTGKKVFMLYYRAKTGKQRRIKIGGFPEITLAEARSRAKPILAKVSLGEDPKADWDKSRAENKIKELTVGDLYAKTLNEYWSKDRFIKSGWKKDVEGFWRNNLEETFGKMAAIKVTPAVIRKWHMGLEDKAFAANRSLEVLSRVFNYAEETELRPIGSNPCTAVEHFQERKRKRFGTLDEAKKLFELLDAKKEKSPASVAFLYTLIHTGARPISIEEAKWDDLTVIEKDGACYGILRFHGKSTDATGYEETVILPPTIMKIVETLPRIQGGKIFNCKMPKKLWQNVRASAGCEDLWARDFRRFFASVGMSLGVNVGTIGELLNHSSTQTTKTYAALMDEARITAVASISNHIDKILKGETV